jgi:hypothetical protein
VSQEIWTLLLKRIEGLAVAARSNKGIRASRVAFNLATATTLAEKAAGRGPAMALARLEVERMLGADTEPSFELRLWRTVRVASFQRSDNEVRPVFVELAWTFLAAVPRRNLQLAAASLLACCKGSKEWGSVVDLFWWRAFAELDSEFLEWRNPWPSLAS